MFRDFFNHSAAERVRSQDRLRTDCEAYEDYRYELRVAANLARSQGSELIRLAGPRTGPDIEFRSTNGKHCGIACYRVRAESLPHEEISAGCARVMGAFVKAFALKSAGVDLGIEVIFERFPPTPRDWEEAAVLLVRSWSPSEPVRITGQGGVQVHRAVELRSLVHLGIVRRVRVRFMFKVGESERGRTMRHIRQKIVKENTWARGFSGSPLFCYEASPWDVTPSREELASVLADSNSAIQGAVSTGLFYTVSGGVAHAMEDLSHYVPGLHLSFHTYGQNTGAWAGDAVMVEMWPYHACAFWDAWEESGRIVSVRSKPLGLTRKKRKVPDESVKSLRDLLRERETLQRIAEEAIRMRDEDDPFDW